MHRLNKNKTIELLNEIIISTDNLFNLLISLKIYNFQFNNVILKILLFMEETITLLPDMFDNSVISPKQKLIVSLNDQIASVNNNSEKDVDLFLLWQSFYKEWQYYYKTYKEIEKSEFRKFVSFN